MTIKLVEDVRHNGKLYPAGEIVDGFTEKEEKRLVELKSAAYVDTKVTSTLNNILLSDGQTPEDGNISPEKFEGKAPEDGEISPEQFEALFKKLDVASNKDPLINAAIAVEVELSEEDLKTKKKVIEEIILQDMVEEVLNEIEKGK